MKKSEFKSLLTEQNQSAKQYPIYYLISLIVFCIIMSIVLFLQINNKLYFNACLTIEILMVILIGIPLIAIDLKNDNEIDKSYKNYKKSGKISGYSDKRNILKIIIVIEIVIALISSGFMVKYFLQNFNITDEEMSITTSEGNVIETEYQDVGKFSIKIPKKFKIMSDEDISLKYPTSNKPTLVYTNENGSINIAFNIDNVALNGKDISEYADVLKQNFIGAGYFVYSSDFEVDGHKICTLRLITPAIDTDIYNYMAIFAIDNKITMLNFNYILDYMSEWTEVAEFIIKSIEFE